MDEWGGQNYMWFQMLAQKGYIVVSVDNRGTDARGEAFRKSTYMNLGGLETKDQIDVAKYFANQPFVDSERIGIFGWSFGGYLSTSCLAKAADVFKMAIAVAPVINWKWYDTIYTERFMRTPKENDKGYEDNSPINFAGQIRGKYLLVHGMADDNVHFQNAAEMARALVSKNIPFEEAYYPNKNHGIYGGYTRSHLYNKMTNFVLDNL
jgi:dipeptidyl-peptidase-4